MEPQELVKMHAALEKLAATAKNEEDRARFCRDMKTFETVFKRYLDIVKTPGGEYVSWDTVKTPSPGMIQDMASLPQPAPESVKELLGKLAVVKLNGGLGTTMGCTGPKSLVEAHHGKTFLDLIVEQLQELNRTYGVDVPLVLLCSFNTYHDTLKVLPKFAKSGVRVFTYLQSTHPRFDAETLLPVAEKLYERDDEWYPPGHVEVFPFLVSSGVYDTLAKEGKEYIFVSNVDNLGALVDLSILNYVHSQKLDFAVEVTPKTILDVKGGTLIDQNGQLRLLEIAQVPREHIPDFESLRTFSIFNTNNMWARMSAMKEIVDSGRIYTDLDLIVNRKPYGKGRTVVQLEIASAASISFFKRSAGICVPRTRFLPVKGTSDLFLVQSDLFEFVNGGAQRNPARQQACGTMALPRARFGPEFKTVKDYLARFPQGVPSIVGLEDLVVSGDVTFGKGVVLRGHVVIVAPPGSKIAIPSGAILENKLVQGNLILNDI